MKKILVTLLVLALCAPAMAVTVAVATDGTVTLDSTEDGVKIVGVGLDLSLSTGTVDDLATAAPWDIYPDAGYDLGGSYTYGAGSPEAIIAGPGQATLPLNPVAICFGNLNGSATPGADGAFVVTFTVTPSVTADLTVTENAARGGIVAVDGTPLDISGQTGAEIIVGGTDCYNGADFAMWETVGKPDSWCYASQCYGDADNATEKIGKAQRQVGYNDIDILLDGFNTAYGNDPIAQPWIAADFDHLTEKIGKAQRRVGYNDIDILLLYFNTAGVPTDCND